jgi:two-component sensor histidine kinase
MGIYKPSLFERLAERAEFAGRISKDGFLLSLNPIRSLDAIVLGSDTSSIFNELLKELSENYARFSINYNLTTSPSDTSLSSGIPIREAILNARRQRNKPLPEELKPDELKVRASLINYLRLIRENSAVNDLDERFRRIGKESEAWSELREEVVNFVNEIPIENEKNQSADRSYTTFIPEKVLRALFKIGKRQVDLNLLKQLDITFMDRTLFPFPDSGFATSEDAWNLYRYHFMHQKSMRFGLVRTEDSRYQVYTINHRFSNALSMIKSLNSTKQNTSHQTLAQALREYTENSQDLFSTSLRVYNVMDNDYKANKGDWLRSLLREFGSVTTIKSLHNDDSLLLTNHRLLEEKSSAHQNTKVTCVNRQLRKLITLGKILSNKDLPVSRAYLSIVPLIERHLKQAFEMNLGVLTSDITGINYADGWLFIPTYLTPSSFPSIGISRPNFNQSENYLKTAITVRAQNDQALSRVENSFRNIFTASRVY